MPCNQPYSDQFSIALVEPVTHNQVIVEDPMFHIHAKVSEATYNAIKQRQAELGITPSELVRRALKLYLSAASGTTSDLSSVYESTGKH